MISQAIADDKPIQRPSQTNKSKPRKKISRPPLDPNRIYSRREAAFALSVSENTLIRARDAGYLQELRAGFRCLHSGQQLLDWLNAGGRTK